MTCGANPTPEGPGNRGLVISLCDLTGNMVRPWAQAGYECHCIDIQHSIRRNRTERAGEGAIIYSWGDVRSWTPPPGRIAIVFAFPPCTDLTVAGARDFVAKRGYRLSDALELFDACRLASEYSRAPYMIENPVGRLSSHRRPPNYTFHPYQFGRYLNGGGDAYTKKRCLWTGGGFVMPEPRPVAPIEGSRMHRLPPSAERANLRSATPNGFARAVFLANEGRFNA